MFPDIHWYDRTEPLLQRRILVGGGNDAQLSVFIGYKPGPARAEPAQCGVLELCFHRVIGAEIPVDGFGQPAGRFLILVGTERLKIQIVIIDAARIVVNGCADIFGKLASVLDQFFQCPAVVAGIILKCLIQIVHIGLKVLVVMNHHGFFVDVGFQRVITVWKRREFKRVTVIEQWFRILSLTAVVGRCFLSSICRICRNFRNRMKKGRFAYTNGNKLKGSDSICQKASCSV